MKDIEVHFAEAVRRRRKRIGMSQEAMAHEAEIHRTYASSIERAKVQVTIEVAGRIAEALGVTLSKLIRDTEKIAADQQTETS